MVYCPVLEVLKNMLWVYRHFDQSKRIAKFEKKNSDTMTFLNSMHKRINHLVYQIYLSKYESTGMSPEL